MAESAGVETDGTKFLWRSRDFRRVRHGSTNYSVHEAAGISLRNIGGVQHLVLKPSLRVFDQTGGRTAD